jgi:hypothetical protein
MAFLAIDSIEVEVQTSNANEEPLLVGDKVRGFFGNLRTTYITQKRTWKFVSGPMTESASNTIRAKNGTFVTIAGSFASGSITALLTVTNAQYIDDQGIDFWRYLSLTLEEQ